MIIITSVELAKFSIFLHRFHYSCITFQEDILRFHESAMRKKRQTLDQQKWLKVLVALLDIYDAVRKAPSSCLSNSMIKKICRLLDETIPNFSPALYFPQRRVLAYRIQPAASSLHDTNLIVIDDIDDFLALMAALELDLKKGMSTPLTEIDVLHEPFFERRDSKSIEYLLRFDSILGDEKLKNYLCIAGEEIQTDPARVADRAVPKGQDKAFKSRLWKDALREMSGNVNEGDFNNPNYYETFDARPNKGSSLAILLIKDGNMSTPGYPDPINRFTDVIRYTLVKYLYLHGSLDRIKICKTCGRLFPERKYGFGIFCSVRCRGSHHVEKEAEQVKKCRDRQNALLRRVYDRPIYDGPKTKEDLKQEHMKKKRPEFRSYLGKYDCQACEEQYPPGDCPVLHRKNPLFAERRAQQKAARSKSKN